MFAHAPAPEEFFARPRGAATAKSPSGSAADAHEREADSFADSIVGGRGSQAPQRRASCACGGGCPRCRAGGEAGASGASGRPLPYSTRALFEPHFGRDLADVRVHADGRAQTSARGARALAYTSGADIFFGAGQYRPETTEGQRLIAHELAHVAQQREGRAPRGSIQRQPAPDATPPAPKGLSMREPVRLELGNWLNPDGASFANPFRNAQANASIYDTGAWALGYGLEKLAKKYPDIDEDWRWRIAEYALGTTLLMTGMTYGHEMGHGREAKRGGGDPDIDLYAPWSGITFNNYPFGLPVSDEQNIRTITAGVNQTQLTASRMYVRMEINRNARYQDAAGYLLQQTNHALYAGRTLAISLFKTPKDADDINNYANRMKGWGLKNLFALAALTDLLSGTAWEALFAQWRFVRHGQRHFRTPSLHAFGQEMSFPRLQMLLTTQGPILGGQVILNPRGRWPVEFTFDTQLREPGDLAGVAVGVKLHDVPVVPEVVPNLHVTPFARATAAASLGIYAGVEVRYELAPWVGISGTLAFRHNDLLAEPEGSLEGKGADIRPAEGGEFGLGLTGRF